MAIFRSEDSGFRWMTEPLTIGPFHTRTPHRAGLGDCPRHDSNRTRLANSSGQVPDGRTIPRMPASLFPSWRPLDELVPLAMISNIERSSRHFAKINGLLP